MSLFSPVLLHLLLCLASTSPEDHGRRQLKHVSSPGSSSKHSDVLIVSLLDGRIVAVDPDGGNVLWSFDSGSPLVSVQQSEASPPGVHIFPGVDGGLYAYHGLDANSARLEVFAPSHGDARAWTTAVGVTSHHHAAQRLPITLPELVESSPSLTEDGSIIVGNRKSSVIMLDVATGRLVQSLSGTLEDRAAEARQLQELMEVEDAIVLGREDFVVRSVQRKTGEEAWNATFGRILRLVFKESSRSAITPPRFTVTADNTLQVRGPGAVARDVLVEIENLLEPPPPIPYDVTTQAFDGKTGFRRWSIAFDVPPVAAYSSYAAGRVL